MNCPQCEKLILAENVNLETLVAKCIRCQHVFHFEPDRPAVDQSSPVRIVDHSTRTSAFDYKKVKYVQYQTNFHKFLHMLQFLILFAGMVFSYFCLFNLSSKPNNYNFLLLEFQMIFVVITLILMFVSKGYQFEIDDKNIVVKGILGYVKQKTFPLSDIRELGYEDGKQAFFVIESNMMFYQLFVRLQNGERTPIGPPMDRIDAEYIVFRMNVWLKPNAQVPNLAIHKAA